MNIVNFFLSPYPLELPLLAFYFTLLMKNSYNWIKILALVAAADKGRGPIYIPTSLLAPFATRTPMVAER